MVEFFKEGGFGMWAILFLGLGLLAAAGRFAARPERRQLGFIGGMAVTTVFATLYALSTDLGTVFGAVADPEKFPRDQMANVLLQGLKESSRPVTFGTLILTVASLLVAAGLARAGAAAPSAREEKPAA